MMMMTIRYGTRTWEPHAARPIPSCITSCLYHDLPYAGAIVNRHIFSSGPVHVSIIRSFAFSIYGCELYEQFVHELVEHARHSQAFIFEAFPHERHSHLVKLLHTVCCHRPHLLPTFLHHDLHDVFGWYTFYHFLEVSVLQFHGGGLIAHLRQPVDHASQSVGLAPPVQHPQMIEKVEHTSLESVVVMDPPSQEVTFVLSCFAVFEALT
mmetsp:Transcript_32542/g.57504  ORF Transcript_32542/g.57504 Transcript_32542/m.57504 type:complete len:209 (-) Transcript_32542:267-893(-)